MYLPKGPDKYVKEIGFNTRVVAFFYDKSEYSEEIKLLKDSATHLSSRYNLRMGIVTDTSLIKEIKRSNPDFFMGEFGMSMLVLRRYDGEIFKVSLAEIKPKDYTWWITDKSTKPVDRENVAII